MSYGGGHRLDVEPVLADRSWAHIEIRPPSTTNIHRVPLPNLRVYQSTDDVAPVPEPDWREDVRQLMQEMNQRFAADDQNAQNLLDRTLPALRGHSEAAVMSLEEQQNALDFTYARFQRLAEQGVHEVVVQPTPVQYVQFLPNTGKSVRARALAGESLTKEREDLEEQMERMEITEGVYLERMNALRDRYNNPLGLALSADASTLAGNNLPIEMRRPRAFETDSNRALIDRAWPPYIVDRAALDDDEPPNNEIPEVD